METAYKLINSRAFHFLADGIQSMGFTPIDESFEVRDDGPHRIYLLEGHIDVSDANQVDPNVILHSLQRYINGRNKIFHVPHFDVYEVHTFGCLQENVGRIILITYFAICHTA